MIFTQDSTQKILSGAKKQTRRLVKEDDKVVIGPNYISIVNCKSDFSVLNVKPRWVIGRDYAVQTGRGKQGLWYCPICKRIIRKILTDDDTDYFYECDCIFCNCLSKTWKPLRIKLTGIRKERLLNISDDDAVLKEGFGSKAELIIYFYNSAKIKYETLYREDDFEELKELKPEIIQGVIAKKNPELWVLDFEVKK